MDGKVIVSGDHHAILALARAGATRRAWSSFLAEGLIDAKGNPEALTLKGRLLKDQARKASGAVAARLYLQSAMAYADAAALRPDSYPLINAATMSLFAGQSDHMALLAQKVLELLDTGIGAGETAYWHEATQAEALMLLGRQTAAQAAFDKAIAAAPAAWEDRAATLRQLRQIAMFRNESTEWLSRYAPPCSLYFKGLIGIAADDTDAAEQARSAVEEANAGFGYGALAAGADILIAEALTERRAELHLVLPILPSAFRAQSVEPFGAAWLARFDNLFEQAASVNVVAAGETLTEAAIVFAAQVAKGAATENANRLEGGASGLELGDAEKAHSCAPGETFVAVKRSAQLPPASLEEGEFIVTLVSDKIGGNPEHWHAVADDCHVYRSGSISAAYDELCGLRRTSQKARCALGLLARTGKPELTDSHVAKTLRMALCAEPGTTIADAASAKAILSAYPRLHIEPMGELPDALGAIEIYVVISETRYGA